jgi:pSer/pThr/pTyr-binding forkhead associated (FHA) protein
MAKLTVTFNGQPQEEVNLDKERVVIGRARKVDIRIDNLAVSSQHAVLVKVLDNVFIEDLHSTNGTLVNGVKIHKQMLRNGDRISVGKHVLLFANETDAKEEEELEKTVLIRPRSAANAASTARIAERAGAALLSNTNIGQGAPKGVLKVLSGPSAGRQLTLTKALITIGRPGKQVAAISRRPQGYYITHIESDGDGKRYPIVNGELIGSRAHPLKSEDHIELAGIKLQFVVH